jgi:hypothetical protein
MAPTPEVGGVGLVGGGGVNLTFFPMHFLCLVVVSGGFNRHHLFNQVPRHQLTNQPTSQLTTNQPTNPSTHESPHHQVMSVLGALTSDPSNEVWVVSGRARRELGAWFESMVSSCSFHFGGPGWWVGRMVVCIG